MRGSDEVVSADCSCVSHSEHLSNTVDTVAVEPSQRNSNSMVPSIGTSKLCTRSMLCVSGCASVDNDDAHAAGSHTVVNSVSSATDAGIVCDTHADVDDGQHVLTGALAMAVVIWVSRKVTAVSSVSMHVGEAGIGFGFGQMSIKRASSAASRLVIRFRMPV